MLLAILHMYITQCPAFLLEGGAFARWCARHLAMLVFSYTMRYDVHEPVRRGQYSAPKNMRKFREDTVHGHLGKAR